MIKTKKEIVEERENKRRQRLIRKRKIESTKESIIMVKRMRSIFNRWERDLKKRLKDEMS